MLHRKLRLGTCPLRFSMDTPYWDHVESVRKCGPCNASMEQHFRKMQFCIWSVRGGPTNSSIRARRRQPVTERSPTGVASHNDNHGRCAFSHGYSSLHSNCHPAAILRNGYRPHCRELHQQIRTQLTERVSGPASSSLREDPRPGSGFKAHVLLCGALPSIPSTYHLF